MSKIAESETVAMSEKEPLMTESKQVEAAVIDSGDRSYSSFPDQRVGLTSPQVRIV